MKKECTFVVLNSNFNDGSFLHTLINDKPRLSGFLCTVIVVGLSSPECPGPFLFG